MSLFKDLRLKKAIGLNLKTFPILGVRLLAYLVFWGVALVYLSVLFFFAWLLGHIAGFLQGVTIIVGLIGVVGLYQLAYRYVFHLLKCAHIAVLAKLLTDGELPDGQGQLAWGKAQVKSRFGEISVLFLVDKMVSGVIRQFTRTVFRLVRWLPGNAGQLTNVIGRVIRYSATYIDEAILARSFWREEDAWKSARDGVVLYGQIWRPILKNAVALMILSYVPMVLVLIVVALPVALVLLMISKTAAAWSVLAIFVLGFLIKIAVGDSIAMTAIIATYKEETDGLAIDPAIDAKLSELSKSFVELKDRASQSMRSSTTATAAELEEPAAEDDTTVPGAAPAQAT